MAPKRRFRTGEEYRVAVIGDEDTVTGFLLSGIGEVDAKKNANFFIVDAKTSHEAVEAALRKLMGRQDIGVILINQHVAEMVRYIIDSNEHIVPAIVEIPSKTDAYDPAKDSVFRRVKQLLGGDSVS